MTNSEINCKYLQAEDNIKLLKQKLILNNPTPAQKKAYQIIDNYINASRSLIQLHIMASQHFRSKNYTAPLVPDTDRKMISSNYSL